MGASAPPLPQRLSAPTRGERTAEGVGVSDRGADRSWLAPSRPVPPLCASIRITWPAPGSDWAGSCGAGAVANVPSWHRPLGRLDSAGRESYFRAVES